MSVSKDFVLAGKSIFTVEPTGRFVAANERKGVEARPHYTYRVSHKPGDEKGGECWFASLLTGSDNESSYTYLGMVDPNTGEVRLTRASRFQPTTLAVRILQRVLHRIWADELALIEEQGWEVHHEGRCGRCGRTLTTPESITSGIGPECRKRMG